MDVQLKRGLLEVCVLAAISVVLAFAIGGIVLLTYGVGHLMLAGFGLVFIGLAILLLFVANKIAKAIISLSKRFVLFIADSKSGSVNVPRSAVGGECEITTASGSIKIEIK